MKNIYKIALAILLALPTVTFAVPVSVDRLNGNHIEPLIKTDYIKASYFVASSTATSTFANGIDLSGGCFAIAGTCLGGGSSQWTTNGSDIYYNTGDVGIGTVAPQNLLEVSGTSAGANLGLLRLSNIGVGTSTGSRLLFTTKDSGNFNLSSTIDSIATDITTAQGKSDLVLSVTNVGSLAERMRITSSGNVGVGTTNPESKLQIGAPYTGANIGSVPVMRILGSALDTTPQTMLRLNRILNQNSFYSGGADFNIKSYGVSGTPFLPKTQLDIALKSTAGQTETADVIVMSLRDNGNVGIGTTSPYMNLSVVGRTKLGYHTLCGDSQPLASSTGSVLLECWGNSAYNVEMGVGNRSNANTAYTDIFLNNDLADSSITHYGSIYLNSSTYNDATYGTGQAFPNQMGIQNTDGLLSLFSSTSTASRNGINFYVGGTNTTNEIARITTAGLGVGSSTPYAKLSVTNTGTAPTALFEDSASPDTTPFIIDNSGNVGIGTSSPGALLDIYRGDLTTGHNQLDVRGQTSADYAANSVAEGVNLRIQNYYTNNYGTAGIIFNPYSNVSGSARIAGVSSPGGDVSLAFQISNNQTIAEAMRIDNLGNVGIGTTTPNDILTVYGGGVGINPGVASRPTCTADTRGDVWNTFGGAGVADTFAVCQKDSADVYAWVTK